jgi:hypothetical protein
MMRMVMMMMVVVVAMDDNDDDDEYDGNDDDDGVEPRGGHTPGSSSKISGMTPSLIILCLVASLFRVMRSICTAQEVSWHVTSRSMY